MKPVLLPVLLFATALAGCSGNGKSATLGQSSPTPTSASTAATGATTCPTGEPSKDLATKPTVAFPAGTTVAAQTTFTDVVTGTGKPAKAGSNVKVKYLGVLFADCKEFDSSWSRGSTDTLPFTVGGGVIPGFSKGVTGMKVGGRRQVLIPAADGYGAQGTGPIPPNAALVFVIDLVSTT